MRKVTWLPTGSQVTALRAMKKIISPLKVVQSKKKMFILNLNNYRNAHYMTLNTVKRNYKEAVREQVEQLPEFKKVIIHYELYPKTRRRTDIGNVTAIHKKFFEDALVELGRIPDDSFDHVIGSTESFGCVDSTNPRVEILITEITDA